MNNTFSQLQDPRFRAAFVMAPGVPVLFHKSAMADIWVSAKNKSTTLLVFWPIFFVTVCDTYLDMNRKTVPRRCTKSRRNLVHLFLAGPLKVPRLVFLSGKDEVLKGREEAYRQYPPPAATFVELPEAGRKVFDAY